MMIAWRRCPPLSALCCSSRANAEPAGRFVADIQGNLFCLLTPRATRLLTVRDCFRDQLLLEPFPVLVSLLLVLSCPTCIMNTSS